MCKFYDLLSVRCWCSILGLKNFFSIVIYQLGSVAPVAYSIRFHFVWQESTSIFSSPGASRKQCSSLHLQGRGGCMPYSSGTFTSHGLFSHIEPSFPLLEEGRHSKADLSWGPASWRVTMNSVQFNFIYIVPNLKGALDCKNKDPTI